MDLAAVAIPGSALIAGVLVLVYSFFCLSLGLLLTMVLFLSKNHYSYIFLLTVSTDLSTIFAIVKLIYFLANWHTLRIDQFQASLDAYDQPALALGPLSKGVDETLFWITLYLYNVDAMLILFWAVALVFSVFNWKMTKLQRRDWVGTLSKVLAWIMPALIVGFRKAYQFHLGFTGAVILLNILLLSSFTFGTICVVLILFKYMKTRLDLTYATGTGLSDSPPRTSANRTGWSTLKKRVEPWLVVRFTAAFISLSALAVFLVLFDIKRYRNAQKASQILEPSFSATGTIQSIINFIPETTCSLLMFLIFGTTYPIRQRYTSILGKINPSRRARPNSDSSHRPSPSQDWNSIGDDIELSRMGSEVTKEITVEISAPVPSESGCQVSPSANAWYHGRKVGIFNDTIP